ncbi:uncharacterized protein LOC125055490 [Pieris napi]|uniref:uncharacterized protein LOC125055490 n=1 Tax=Pieris napi TaxID=78633 RepID=UPI001FBB960A|nr:uncharacterized protein LOC125055490 [Pieris napi]
MMKGRGLLLLEKAMEATSKEAGSTAQQRKIKICAENEANASPSSLVVSPVTSSAITVSPIAASALEVSPIVASKKSLTPDKSNESDFIDDSDTDPTFSIQKRQKSRPPVIPRRVSSSSCSSTSSDSSSSSSSSSSSNSSSDNESNRPGPSAADTQVVSIEPAPTDPKPRRKRVRNPAAWKSKIAKTLRNTGKSYVSLSNPTKKIAERRIRPPCGDKCKLKCKIKINEEARQDIFEKYWILGDLERQREYIVRHTQEIKPKYRYITSQKLRALNSAYYFEIDGVKIRVCKDFFKATLSVCDRYIKTALSKKRDDGFIDADARGKHGNQRKIDSEVKDSVFNFINSIPRIESHYLRAQTTREYISCEKCLADLYRDYKNLREQNNLPPASASTFSRIFNEEFNISFYVPKKDQCDLCESYKNADGEDNARLSENYENHLKEKGLARLEKEADKNNKNVVVAVYDLQAVMQVPKGQVSLFFYKSRINCLNLTVSDLNAKDVVCFFWDETEAKRGANEIGSCVLAYIELILAKSDPNNDVDIIFYSDNCCGQQKNKYLLSVYAYAVNNMLRVNSITHKFLIRGHSQNEGDNVHSVIEKQIKRHLKSGPIYCPQQYATLIRTAKKTGQPYHVKELLHNDFYDLKVLQESWGNNFNVDEDNNQVKWIDIKQLRVEKQHPLIFFYKTSYSETDFKKVCVRNRSRRYKDQNFSPQLLKAYTEKQPLAENKKRDIMELIEKNIIPTNYVNSYYKTALNLE